MRWVIVLLTVSTAHAGPDQKAQLHAAPLVTAMIDGATVRIGVDRSVVGTGENVQVALAASQRVTAAVVLVGSIISDAIEDLTLHGRANVPLEPGRAMQVPVRVDGLRGAFHETFDRYRVLVLSRAEADALERADADTVKGIVRAAPSVSVLAHARSSAVTIAMPIGSSAMRRSPSESP